MTDQIRGEAEGNPYEAPKAAQGPGAAGGLDVLVFGEDAPATVRAAHLAQETTVRTIGMVYYIMAGFSLVNLGVIIARGGKVEAMAKAEGSVVPPEVLRTVMIVSALAGAAICAGLGHALRGLRNWVRWVIVAFSAFGILGLLQTLALLVSRAGWSLQAIGLVFSIALSLMNVVLLLRTENQVVFSPRYRRVVAETPTILPEMGTRDYILLGLVVTASVLGIAGQWL